MEQGKPKDSNTSLVIIIIVLAVLVVVAIGIGTYYYGKSKSGATTASPSATKTATPKASAKASATPKSNATTAAADEAKSAQEFVESFMKMTLGTLPGASLNVDKAYAELSDTMKAQYSGPSWVPQFYGIQDGPDDFQFLFANPVEDGGYVVKYNALFGNEVGLGWAFTVVKDGDSWVINGFSNTTQ